MSITTTFQRAFRTNRIDPYPMEILKRIDRPTTVIKEDEVPRLDERESGFNRALRGDWGAGLSHERHRFVAKHPLSGALVQMQFTLSEIVDGTAAIQKAPGTENPIKMARHIKETAYFLRADQVGSSGSFGAVPVFLGTLLITGISMIVAVPIGLMSAIYMTFYADQRVRAVSKQPSKGRD